MSSIFLDSHKEYMVLKIKSGKVCHDPFWHIEINDFLHPDILQLCNINFPEQNYTLNPVHYNQNRKSFKLTDFWSTLEEFLNNDEFKQEIVNHGMIDIPTKSSLAIWEDTLGYTVQNHLDNPIIHATVHVYLGNDSRLEKYGTQLMEPKDQGSKILKQFLYKENFAWITMNTNTTWHGMLTKVDEPVKRRTIMFRYIKKSITDRRNMKKPYVL